MSTRTFTAPRSVPDSSRIGLACASAVRRVPSGRSTTISCPLNASRACSASAIQHLSWVIGVPSAAKSLNDPQKRSTGSFSFGARPQSRTAAGL
jgi:hypothetical protein